jgi:mannose-6-phosphate isomerase
MERKRFPLLVKLLDAHQDLSVQVHPGDRYALSHEHGELGKTEMWYFLSVAPDTRIILGLRPGATPAAFSEALQAGSLPDLLNYLPVSAGDAVEVRTGTIHALLAGAVVTEIQQNSDLTYRVYDWGRLGVDGTPRPLHIQQALDVIDFDAPHGEPVVPLLLTGSGRPRRFELARNRYFVVEKVELGAGAGYRGRCDGSTLEIWGCIDGHATIRWDGEPVQLPAIRYSLLPAALGSFSITAATSSVCLRIYLPPAGLDDVPGAKSI